MLGETGTLSQHDGKEGKRQGERQVSEQGRGRTRGLSIEEAGLQERGSSLSAIAA